MFGMLYQACAQDVASSRSELCERAEKQLGVCHILKHLKSLNNMCQTAYFVLYQTLDFFMFNIVFQLPPISVLHRAILQVHVCELGMLLLHVVWCMISPGVFT